MTRPISGKQLKLLQYCLTPICQKLHWDEGEQVIISGEDGDNCRLRFVTKNICIGRESNNEVLVGITNSQKHSSAYNPSFNKEVLKALDETISRLVDCIPMEIYSIQFTLKSKRLLHYEYFDKGVIVEPSRFGIQGEVDIFLD